MTPTDLKPRVYALEDPDAPGTYHYVGQLTTDVGTRMSNHLCHAIRRNGGGPVGAWIRELNEQGRVPRPVLLGGPATEAETIRALLEQGHPLKNVQPGGEGPKAGPPLTPDQVARLGDVPARTIAEESGLSVRTVRRRRAARGIPPARPAPRYDWADVDGLLGTVPDRVVADRLGCSVSAVGERRRSLGVRSHREAESVRRQAQDRPAAPGRSHGPPPAQPGLTPGGATP